MLLRLKSPLTNILSSYQGGGRKGHTTITKATALWSNVLQFDGEPYVVLLDIAKASPALPTPCCGRPCFGWVSPPPDDCDIPSGLFTDPVFFPSREATLLPPAEGGQRTLPPLPHVVLCCI